MKSLILTLLTLITLNVYAGTDTGTSGVFMVKGSVDQRMASLDTMSKTDQLGKIGQIGKFGKFGNMGFTPPTQDNIFDNTIAANNEIFKAMAANSSPAKGIQVVGLPASHSVLTEGTNNALAAAAKKYLDAANKQEDVITVGETSSDEEIQALAESRSVFLIDSRTVMLQPIQIFSAESSDYKQVKYQAGEQFLKEVVPDVADALEYSKSTQQVVPLY